MNRKSILRLLMVVSLTSPVWAKDFGSAPDVAKIKTLVKNKFGQVANVSISHDWAMCISNSGEDDLTILLRLVGGRWQIVAHDGGAFDEGTLRAKGVPAGDIGPLLRTYRQ
jgi:hypothetical protein